MDFVSARVTADISAGRGGTGGRFPGSRESPPATVHPPYRVQVIQLPGLDETLMLRALLAGGTAVLFVGGVMVLAERMGSKLGGLLLGLPGPALISLIFIAVQGGGPAMQRTAASS